MWRLPRRRLEAPDGVEGLEERRGGLCDGLRMTSACVVSGVGGRHTDLDGLVRPAGDLADVGLLEGHEADRELDVHV